MQARLSYWLNQFQGDITSKNYKEVPGEIQTIVDGIWCQPVLAAAAELNMILNLNRHL